VLADADLDLRVREKSIRRNHQVRRRRDALVDTPSQVELRLMTRTEKAAEPFGAEVTRRDFGAVRGRAPEGAANADGNEHFGLDRAIFVLAVDRLLQEFGFRIGDAVVEVRGRVPGRLRGA